MAAVPLSIGRSQSLRWCLRALALVLWLVPGGSFAQSLPSWETAGGDDRFAGSHATIQLGALEGAEAGELRIGCDASDPGFPSIVLTAERDLGMGQRDLYARIIGLRETSMHRGEASGKSIVLAGFDAVVLLTEVLAAGSARSLFLRLEGGDGGAWSVPLTGLRDALSGLPCLRGLV